MKIEIRRTTDGYRVRINGEIVIVGCYSKSEAERMLALYLAAK